MLRYNLKKILIEEDEEKTITVFRGTSGWFPKRHKNSSSIEDSGVRMTQDGNFVGPGGPQFSHPIEDRQMKDTTMWVTDNHEMAKDSRFTGRRRDQENVGPTLEFEMPESYFNEFAGVRENDPDKVSGHLDSKRIYFEDGIPKKYFKKLHKGQSGKIPLWSGK
jgi:hypothetical protein|tara:strand:- start:1207 stop:1695 length:489 start_codon:yes stop_codon:yes gene_type:complete